MILMGLVTSSVQIAAGGCSKKSLRPFEPRAVSESQPFAERDAGDYWPVSTDNWLFMLEMPLVIILQVKMQVQNFSIFVQMILIKILKLVNLFLLLRC